jgi:glucosamine-6-phosphate deaminase
MIAKAIREKPDLVIIPATGNTPLATYRELAILRRDAGLDTSRLRVFQLDDYLHVKRDDPRSLYGWMKRAFLDPLGIQDRQVVRLGDDVRDPEVVCAGYDRALEQAGGADLVILGLGPNGHLGFNEPPSDRNASTRVVKLTAASIASNAAYFTDPVPARALTAGMPALLSAEKILLLVSGTGKQDILDRTLRGPVTAEVPASYLQECSQATIFADRDALGPSWMAQ